MASCLQWAAGEKRCVPSSPDHWGSPAAGVLLGSDAPPDGVAVRAAMGMNAEQTALYNAMAVPAARGMIAKGSNLTGAEYRRAIAEPFLPASSA